MRIEKAEYESVYDFVRMCATMIAENPGRYDHVDPSDLRLVLIVNREPPTDGPRFKIVRVSNPVALFCSFKYVVVAWRQTWNALTESRRNLFIYEVFEHLNAGG